MKRLLLTPLILALSAGPALAADATTHAKAKADAKPATSTMSKADRKALAAEERDRLAREKKDLVERQKLLETQLQTSQKLVAEKDALLKQLQDEIAAIKAGKPVPADKAADSKPAAAAKTKPAK